MPEVAECYTMGKQINQIFGNRKLLNLVFEKPPGKKTYNCAYQTLDILKKIILELENDVYIVVSPLMTGSFLIKKGEHSYTHFVFDGNNSDEKNEEKESIAYFNDSRRFGLINTYFTK